VVSMIVYVPLRRNMGKIFHKITLKTTDLTYNRERDIKLSLTILNLESVISSRQALSKHSSLVDNSIQFTEIGEGSRSHPHDEIFVEVTIVGLIGRIQVIDWFAPIRRRQSAIERYSHKDIRRLVAMTP